MTFEKYRFLSFCNVVIHKSFMCREGEKDGPLRMRNASVHSHPGLLSRYNDTERREAGSRGSDVFY